MKWFKLIVPPQTVLDHERFTANPAVPGLLRTLRDGREHTRGELVYFGVGGPCESFALEAVDVMVKKNFVAVRQGTEAEEEIDRALEERRRYEGVNLAIYKTIIARDVAVLHAIKQERRDGGLFEFTYHVEFWPAIDTTANRAPVYFNPETGHVQLEPVPPIELSDGSRWEFPPIQSEWPRRWQDWHPERMHEGFLSVFRDPPPFDVTPAAPPEPVQPRALAAAS